MTGVEGSEAATEGELSEERLRPLWGGVFVRPKLIANAPATRVGWSGEPYQPEEDVEAY